MRNFKELVFESTTIEGCDEHRFKGGKMEFSNKRLSRRSLFQVGAGAIGALATTQAVAQVCGSATGAQALGPFFPKDGTPQDPIRENPDPTSPISLANDNDLTFVRGRSGTASGQIVHIKGTVTDDLCVGVPNATLIIWQASERGRYNHKGDDENQDFADPRTGAIIRRTLDKSFQYWGKTNTDSNGNYQFKTIVPGFYPADLPGGWYRPPHIHFMISATGYPQLVTQMYFRGATIKDNVFVQELNSKDLLLQSSTLTAVERSRLIVDFVEDPTLGNALSGQFDIVLRR